MTDNNIACVVGVPLMRVEEMYFIEAEAVAHADPAQGLQLCSDFMKRYRYATYSSNATALEDVIDEIVFQKRVELFGEGQAYFDYKRLNMDVDRTYSGTNFNWGRHIQDCRSSLLDELCHHSAGSRFQQGCREVQQPQHRQPVYAA